MAAGKLMASIYQDAAMGPKSTELADSADNPFLRLRPFVGDYGIIPINYWVIAYTDTERQFISGTIMWFISRPNDLVSAKSHDLTATETGSFCTSGTLSATFDSITEGQRVTLRCNPVSSLVGPTITLYYQVMVAPTPFNMS